MSATPLNCAFCGADFTEFSRGCTSCPLNTGCDLVRCPRCGYQFPRTSQLIEWFRKIFLRVSGTVHGE